MYINQLIGEHPAEILFSIVCIVLLIKGFSKINNAIKLKKYLRALMYIVICIITFFATFITIAGLYSTWERENRSTVNIDDLNRSSSYLQRDPKEVMKEEGSYYGYLIKDICKTKVVGSACMMNSSCQEIGGDLTCVINR